MSDVLTDHTAFTNEELKRQQAAVLAKRQVSEPTILGDYAAKLFADETSSVSEDVIMQRAMASIYRASGSMAQVMEFEDAKRCVWNIGNEMLCQQKGVRGQTIWNVTGNEAILRNMTKWFIGDASGDYDLYKGLYLLGNVGRGKTFLMRVFSLFADAANIEARKFKFAACGDVADDVLFSGAQIDGAISKYCKDQYLFDDLGQEQASGKSFGNEVSVMERIISKRYQRFVSGGLITHITSNDTPENIKIKYGDRVADRLREMFTTVYVKGESHRK